MGIKQPGHEAYNLTPYGAEFKNKSPYIPLLGVHGNNFTCTITITAITLTIIITSIGLNNDDDDDNNNNNNNNNVITIMTTAVATFLVVVWWQQ